MSNSISFSLGEFKIKALECAAFHNDRPTIESICFFFVFFIFFSSKMHWRDPSDHDHHHTQNVSDYSDRNEIACFLLISALTKRYLVILLAADRRLINLRMKVLCGILLVNGIHLQLSWDDFSGGFSPKKLIFPHNPDCHSEWKFYR